jgi:NDP-sugar pyrophosphorylase family protein
MRVFDENNIGFRAVTGLRAVIPADGKAARLAPFTVDFPKPLVPPGDMPVLEILIQGLIRHGIADIGRPDDYARAQEMFAEKREEFVRV